MKRLGVAELKDQLSKHLRSVQAGAEIEVTDRARAIARIVPVAPAQAAVEFTEPTRPFSEVRDIVYPPLDPGFDVVELLLEDRRKR